MIIERTPVSDRLPQTAEIYNRYLDALQEIENLKAENNRLNTTLQSYTRVVVENNILKERMQEMKEELLWAGISTR